MATLPNFVIEPAAVAPVWPSPAPGAFEPANDRAPAQAFRSEAATARLSVSRIASGSGHDEDEVGIRQSRVVPCKPPHAEVARSIHVPPIHGTCRARSEQPAVPTSPEPHMRRSAFRSRPLPGSAAHVRDLPPASCDGPTCPSGQAV